MMVEATKQQSEWHAPILPSRMAGQQRSTAARDVASPFPLPKGRAASRDRKATMIDGRLTMIVTV